MNTASCARVCSKLCETPEVASGGWNHGSTWNLDRVPGRNALVSSVMMVRIHHCAQPRSTVRTHPCMAEVRTFVNVVHEWHKHPLFNLVEPIRFCCSDRPDVVFDLLLVFPM